MTWLHPQWRRIGEGTWLHRWLAGRGGGPEAFLCGVRVTAGAVERESTRWRFRLSAVDRMIEDGVATLNHGPVTLRIRPVAGSARAGQRPHHAVFDAVEQGTGARVEISAPLGDLIRFGVES